MFDSMELIMSFLNVFQSMFVSLFSYMLFMVVKVFSRSFLI
jgi:hypothetical protein